MRPNLISKETREKNLAVHWSEQRRQVRQQGAKSCCRKQHYKMISIAYPHWWLLLRLIRNREGEREHLSLRLSFSASPLCL